MSAISFLVVSTPRSATAFMARKLSSLGIDCGHEQYFNPHHQLNEDREKDFFGDASWLAVPYLESLPTDTVVLHQVRDPLKSINSMLYTGHLNFEIKGNPYIDFIKQYVPFSDDVKTKEQKAMFFWSYWHQRIEYAAQGRSYFRYRIETLQSASSLDQIFSALNRRSSILRAEDVPHDVNHRGEPPQYVGREDLTPDIIRLARKFGYENY